MRKALAMGATSGVLVTDPAIEGSDTVTTRILAAALKTLEFDLVFAGVDTSDGTSGLVAPGVAVLTGLPYLSYAATIEPDTNARTVRVRRIAADGYDVLEAPMPALISGTQALGEPRYPSLKGIMAARSKEITTIGLSDLGIDPATVEPRRRPADRLQQREPRAATRRRPQAPDDGPPGRGILAERRII